MKSTASGLITYVSIQPPGNDPSIYNCVISQPGGNVTFRMTIPMALDPKLTSITTRATTLGQTRILNAVPTVVGDTTQLDIYGRTDDGTPSGADFMEVSVYRLPLA